MSIASKHAYRFKYLKSEQWQAVRLEALVREHGKCQICGEESIFNDAHHIWYPDNIYETAERHLAILCRPCHEFAHAVIPECRTRHEGKGIQQWMAFRNAIAAWRISKADLFTNADGAKTITPHALLSELNSIKTWISGNPQSNGKVTLSKNDLGMRLSTLKRLAEQ